MAGTWFGVKSRPNASWSSTMTPSFWSEVMLESLKERGPLIAHLLLVQNSTTTALRAISKAWNHLADAVPRWLALKGLDKVLYHRKADSLLSVFRCCANMRSMGYTSAKGFRPRPMILTSEQWSPLRKNRGSGREMVVR